MHNYNLSYMHWVCLFAPIWISYWGGLGYLFPYGSRYLMDIDNLWGGFPYTIWGVDGGLMHMENQNPLWKTITPYTDA